MGSENDRCPEAWAGRVSCFMAGIFSHLFICIYGNISQPGDPIYPKKGTILLTLKKDSG